jgi:hypothetical protein
MRYLHRPKFWLLLLVAEVGSFFLASILAAGVSVMCLLAGMPEKHMGRVFLIIGILLNRFCAVSVFRSVRAGARSWPEPRGFPVIVAEDRKTR